MDHFCIDADNIGKIEINVSEYVEEFSLQKSHAVYNSLREAVKSIMRKPVKIDIGNNELKELAWLSSNEYKKTGEGSKIILRFSTEIEPYLFELKDRFTAINFKYAARLNTPFSFRLYQWLYKAKDLHKYKKG